MRAMADFVAGLKHPHACHLLPYHGFADSKYRLFHMKQRFYLAKTPGTDKMKAFQGIWSRRGIETQIGG